MNSKVRFNSNTILFFFQMSKSFSSVCFGIVVKFLSSTLCINFKFWNVLVTFFHLLVIVHFKNNISCFFSNRELRIVFSLTQRNKKRINLLNSGQFLTNQKKKYEPSSQLFYYQDWTIYYEIYLRQNHLQSASIICLMKRINWNNVAIIICKFNDAFGA